MDFAAQRLTETGRFRLFARGAASGVGPAEVGDVARRWTEEPAGNFGSATQLAGPSLRLRTAIHDVLIGEVDDQLQAIYQAALHDRGCGPSMPHRSRFQVFRSLGAQAFALTARYDWRWLDQWSELPEGSSRNRLSNFALRHDRVNLRFTYHCNAACRHCYNESGPTRKGALLDANLVRGIIREMPGLGIGALNLTGGEPLLYPQYVGEVVAEARRAGIEEVSIYTNGFWATSIDEAADVLRDLQRFGFMTGRDDHIKASTGRYHEEFIHFQRILNLASAYQSMFGAKLIVDVEIDGQEPEQSEAFLGRVKRSGLESAMAVHFRRVMPHGRGEDLAASASGGIGRPCRLIDQIVFEPGGTARPCCGFNNENQGVVIGDLAQHSLRVLIKRMQNDPLLQLLSSQPIERVFDVVDVRPRPTGYSNICSLCQHAVGGLSDKTDITTRLFSSQRFYPFWFTEHAALFAEDAFPES